MYNTYYAVIQPQAVIQAPGHQRDSSQQNDHHVFYLKYPLVPPIWGIDKYLHCHCQLMTANSCSIKPT